MRTTIPDEHGWYWLHVDLSDEWCMAFVDTNRERALIWDGEDARGPSVHTLDDDHLGQEIGDCQWYGPLSCPGGDFGSHIVVASEEEHRRAKAEGKVIGIEHYDFRYCRDEGHGSSLTVSGVYSREEAARRMRELTGAE